MEPKTSTNCVSPRPETQYLVRDNMLAGMKHFAPPIIPEKLLRTGRIGDTLLVSVEIPSHARINDIQTEKGSCLGKLKQEIANLPAECNIIISLAGLAYLASPAITALEALEQRLNANERRLEFCGLNRANLELFKVMWKGGWKHENYADEAAALAALGSKGLQPIA